MIDLKYIKEHPQEIKTLFKKRGCSIDVDAFISLQNSLNAKKAKMDLLKAEQKKADRETATELKIKIATLKKEIDAMESERDTLWLVFPNLLASDTPDGKSDMDNVEIKRVGNIKEFGFEPKPHEILGKNLGILDLERGAKVSGSGFYFWTGEGADLTAALYSFSRAILKKHGFTFMIPPVFATKRTFMGTGYFPFEPEQNYKVENENLYAIGTSEQTLLAFHDGEILSSESLPLKYFALTPCFRTEAGSYGKQSKGAFRVHQFHKMEQIIFCMPEDSENWHRKCLEYIEELMYTLEVPYRVVHVCVGDMGAPGYKKYDVEAWFPSFKEFRETHSNTNLLDFQTRRLGIRASLPDGKKVLPHTISSTMATDRIVLAIMENFQQIDGSIVIPKVLREFMGGREVIGK
jgi:seryl-tRNA synthetase